jgi:segregation and condensation protein B
MPKIREVLADQVIQPTLINPADFEQASALVVTDDGELVIAEEDKGTEEQTNKEQGTNEVTNNDPTINQRETRNGKPEKDEQGTEE